MPRYSFKCNSCEHKFELKISIDELEKSDNLSCEQCGNKEVTQIIVKTGILRDGLSKSKDIPPCASGGGCSGGKCPY